jgi:hypothetical protein
MQRVMCHVDDSPKHNRNLHVRPVVDLDLFVLNGAVIDVVGCVVSLGTVYAIWLLLDLELLVLSASSVTAIQTRVLAVTSTSLKSPGSCMADSMGDALALHREDA